MMLTVEQFVKYCRAFRLHPRQLLGMTMPGFEQHPMTANMARKVERLL